jgi:hypothetical protein
MEAAAEPSMAMNPSDLLKRLRGTARPLVKWASRRVFGNTWSYQRNLDDIKKWSDARRAYTGEVDPTANAFYRRFGYYPVPHGTLDLGVMARIKAKYEALIDDDAHASNPFDDDPQLFKVYNHGGLDGKPPKLRRDFRNVAGSIPEVMEIFDDRLNRRLCSALGSNFTVERVSAMRSFHVPPHISSRFEATTDRWHYDPHGADRLRLFVLVSDVTLDDGPTSFFDRRYSRHLMLQGFDESKRKDSENSGIPDRLMRDNPHMIQHIGRTGSAMAVQTSNCLHRGGVRAPGTQRDLVIFTVRASAQMSIPTGLASSADGYIGQ